MQRFVQFCCLLLLIPPSPTRAADPEIFPADAKLELLFTRSADIHGGLTEGPAAAADGSIYFTDIPFDKDLGMILRFDPKTMKTTVFSSNSGKANGMKFDAQGNLIACEGADYGGRRVSRWNIKTNTRETIVDKIQGQRFNSPNDLDIDRKGRIYFTDPRYSGPESRELEHRAVYRIDTDGTVIEVTHEVEQPNGIALSPDDRTLYVVDHNARRRGRESRPECAAAETGGDEGLRLSARQRRTGCWAAKDHPGFRDRERLRWNASRSQGSPVPGLSHSQAARHSGG